MEFVFSFGGLQRNVIWLTSQTCVEFPSCCVETLYVPSFVEACLTLRFDWITMTHQQGMYSSVELFLLCVYFGMHAIFCHHGFNGIQRLVTHFHILPTSSCRSDALLREDTTSHVGGLICNFVHPCIASHLSAFFLFFVWIVQRCSSVGSAFVSQPQRCEFESRSSHFSFSSSDKGDLCT